MEIANKEEHSLIKMSTKEENQTKLLTTSPDTIIHIRKQGFVNQILYVVKLFFLNEWSHDSFFSNILLQVIKLWMIKTDYRHSPFLFKQLRLLSPSLASDDEGLTQILKMIQLLTQFGSASQESGYFIFSQIYTDNIKLFIGPQSQNKLYFQNNFTIVFNLCIQSLSPKQLKAKQTILSYCSIDEKAKYKIFLLHDKITFTSRYQDQNGKTVKQQITVFTDAKEILDKKKTFIFSNEYMPSSNQHTLSFSCNNIHNKKQFNIDSKPVTLTSVEVDFFVNINCELHELIIFESPLSKKRKEEIISFFNKGKKQSQQFEELMLLFNEDISRQNILAIITPYTIVKGQQNINFLSNDFQCSLASSNIFYAQNAQQTIQQLIGLNFFQQIFVLINYASTYSQLQLILQILTNVFVNDFFLQVSLFFIQDTFQTLLQIYHISIINLFPNNQQTIDIFFKFLIEIHPCFKKKYLNNIILNIQLIDLIQSHTSFSDYYFYQLENAILNYPHIATQLDFKKLIDILLLFLHKEAKQQNVINKLFQLISIIISQQEEKQIYYKEFMNIVNFFIAQKKIPKKETQFYLQVLLSFMKNKKFIQYFGNRIIQSLIIIFKMTDSEKMIILILQLLIDTNNLDDPFIYTFAKKYAKKKLANLHNFIFGILSAGVKLKNKHNRVLSFLFTNFLHKRKNKKLVQNISKLFLLASFLLHNSDILSLFEKIILLFSGNKKQFDSLIDDKSFIVSIFLHLQHSIKQNDNNLTDIVQICFKQFFNHVIIQKKQYDLILDILDTVQIFNLFFTYDEHNQQMLSLILDLIIEYDFMHFAASQQQSVTLMIIKYFLQSLSKQQLSEMLIKNLSIIIYQLIFSSRQNGKVLLSHTCNHNNHSLSMSQIMTHFIVLLRAQASSYNMDFDFILIDFFVLLIGFLNQYKKDYYVYEQLRNCIFSICSQINQFDQQTVSQLFQISDASPFFWQLLSNNNSKPTQDISGFLSFNYRLQLQIIYQEDDILSSDWKIKLVGVIKDILQLRNDSAPANNNYQKDEKRSSLTKEAIKSDKQKINNLLMKKYISQQRIINLSYNLLKYHFRQKGIIDKSELKYKVNDITINNFVKPFIKTKPVIDKNKLHTSNQIQNIYQDMQIDFSHALNYKNTTYYYCNLITLLKSIPCAIFINKASQITIYKNININNKIRSISVSEYAYKNHKKIKYQIDPQQIVFVSSYHFLGQATAIKVILQDKRTIIMNFQNIESRQSLQSQLELHTKNNQPQLSFLQEQKKWSRQQMTTFDYLQIVNQLSNRDFNDLSQYPIMPLLLTKQFPKIVLRDLSKPIGLIGNEQKKKEIVQRFSQSGEGYYFSTHYSTPYYVLGFLIRLEPFARGAKQLQNGKFDQADRIFNSVENYLSSIENEITDQRELLPEFFYLPELFCNLNNFDFGCNQGGISINDVVFSYNTNVQPFLFIYQLNQLLENESTSQSINKWIDIIFGHQSNGKLASKAQNVYHPLAYNHGKIDPFQAESKYIQKFYYGQIPQQIITQAHIQRQIPVTSKSVMKEFIQLKYHLQILQSDQKKWKLLAFQIFDGISSDIFHYSTIVIVFDNCIQTMSLKQHFNTTSGFSFKLIEEQKIPSKELQTHLTILGQLPQYEKSLTFYNKNMIIYAGLFNGFIALYNIGEKKIYKKQKVSECIIQFIHYIGNDQLVTLDRGGTLILSKINKDFSVQIKEAIFVGNNKKISSNQVTKDKNIFLLFNKKTIHIICVFNNSFRIIHKQIISSLFEKIGKQVSNQHYQIFDVLISFGFINCVTLIAEIGEQYYVINYSFTGRHINTFQLSLQHGEDYLKGALAKDKQGKTFLVVLLSSGGILIADIPFNYRYKRIDPSSNLQPVDFTPSSSTYSIIIFDANGCINLLCLDPTERKE